MKKLRCIILSHAGHQLAKQMQYYFPNMQLWTPEKLHIDNSYQYQNFGDLIRSSFKENYNIIAICSASILIRVISPLLKNSKDEPILLALGQDGGYCVPLLGINKGANTLAKQIANYIDSKAAITTSGNLSFNIDLLNPPHYLKLVNPHQGKSFISQLLNGAKVKITKNDIWLQKANLPLSNKSELEIIICKQEIPKKLKSNCLYYQLNENSKLANSQLSILGFGPGDASYLTNEARQLLKEADAIFGYAYYIDLIKPLVNNALIFKSNNTEELKRAKEALDFASKGHKVVLVSSGDPSIFAMASTVMELLNRSLNNESWYHVNIKTIAGITASLAASAKFGAFLGHDCSFISLSDNLKPWSVIEKRISNALESDMIIAIYNPISKIRNQQIHKLKLILDKYCENDRLIAIATDISRENEEYTIVKLKDLNLDYITSRSIILIGSSKSKNFYFNNKQYAYTPRFY